MKISKPSLDWTKILAGGMIILGMLFFLICIHILSISTGGGVSQVLGTSFRVFLWLFVSCIIFGFVGILIQLLRYLVWKINTPEWQQREVK